jgi:hypothetical protein
VNEAEWLACTDPQKMLEFLKGKATDRKRRLVAVACCWRILALMPKECRLAVEVAERCADGMATEKDSWEAWHAAGSAARNTATDPQKRRAAYCAYRAVEPLDLKYPDYDYPGVWHEDWLEGAVKVVAEERAWNPDYHQWRESVHRQENLQIANIIRDIFGNPFRPITISPAVLSWNDAVVVRLAQAAYEERHMPSGTLDSVRLAVLADALEEAGCTDVDILGHLRGPGPHVRGCWPVDLCLGKS